MNNESDINIDKIIEQARRDRSIALGNLIASGTRKSFSWLLNRGNRLLQVMLMSPVNSR